MITVLHETDAKERDRLRASDPFQLAAPCWSVRVLPSLPPEHRHISIEELNTYMPIRVVPAAEAPSRLRGSKMSTNSDYNDVLTALKDPSLKKDTALVVNMASPSWTERKDGKPVYEKPEVSFAYTLRRYFEGQKLPLIAYQSGKMEVTIRRKTAAEQVVHTRQRK